jgi:hypothetical protein
MAQGYVIGNDPPSEGELWTAVSQLSHAGVGEHQGYAQSTKQLVNGGKRGEMWQRRG